MQQGGEDQEVRPPVPPFDENGLMKRRDVSINDCEIDETERRIF